MRDKSTQTTKGNAERTAELLREKIRSGELSNEGKIPSIRKLADLPGFGDRNAIWRALLTLKEERYVTTTPTGRYLVHPRFLLNHSAQKTLTVAFVGEGESALNNAFIQSIHTALASNHDGYNIQLDLRLVSPTNQPQVTDLHSYDAIILTDRWSLPLFKALKQKGKLVTSLVAPRRFNIALDNPLFGNPIRFQRLSYLSSQRFVVLFNIILQQIDRLIGHWIILPIRLNQVLHFMRMIHPYRHIRALRTCSTQQYCDYSSFYSYVIHDYILI